jgi:haloalkane dehalogenase
MASRAGVTSIAVSSPISSRGHRVVAPDLVGFGRSDKPARRDDYTYERHVQWMSDWLTQLDLTGITLFCQDWGGLIGLRLVAAFPDRFARVVVSNTGLPVGTGATDGFRAWLDFSQNVPVFPVGMIVNGGCHRDLSPAKSPPTTPLPRRNLQGRRRQFPTLVPITPEHGSVAENKAAWDVLARFDKPLLTAFGAEDAITRGGERPFIDRVPGAKGQAHTVLQSAGHFLQEDVPAELCTIIDTLIRGWEATMEVVNAVTPGPNRSPPSSAAARTGRS